MIGVHDKHSSGAAAVRGIDQHPALACFLHQTFDRCGVRADDCHHAPRTDHIAKAVLVPCTAFDADCFRVGMGKGYYDRYLPRCTKAAKIGIALEVQRVAHAAVDEHDQRLDAFVTERGIYTWK